MCLDLFKILNDNNCTYQSIDNKELIDVVDIRSHFKYDDLILSSVSPFQIHSKLLNPEVNKGFYLKYNTKDGGRFTVRVPAAKLLIPLVSKLPNGDYIYPMILINISKMLRDLLNRNYGFFYNTNKGNYQSSSWLYLEQAKGMLSSSGSDSQQLIQTFTKPEVLGINMKQMADITIPDDVVVILDSRIYKKLLSETLGDDAAPLYGLAIRNPVLWSTQVQRVRIWNECDYAIHLQMNYGIDLHDYMDVQFNKSLLLISTYMEQVQHSDIDGDLLSVFLPKEKEGQQLTKEFKLRHVLPEELQWTKDFIAGELSANDKFDKPKVYKLNEVNLQTAKMNNYYGKYLSAAAAAKSNIGMATIDIWSLNILIECYRYLSGLNKTWEMDSITENFEKISDYEHRLLSFNYVRLVEEKVINSIKHVENGSSEFRKFYLDNLTDSSAVMTVYKALTNELHMENKLATKLLRIVHWAKQTGFLKTVKDYISIYNSGANKDIDYDQETVIDKHTYFGSLMHELIDIRSVINGYRLPIEGDTSNEVVDLEFDLDIDFTV